MKTLHPFALFASLALFGCGGSPEPEPPVDPFEAVSESLATCSADEECKAKLEAVELGSCPWYEAVGCSALTVAAGAACVVTEGEACLEALELVKAAGCCDCLPKGEVRDICKALAEEKELEEAEAPEERPVGPLESR